LIDRLDKFWGSQDLIFDYKADVTGIGNKSSTYNNDAQWSFVDTMYYVI